MNTFILNVFAAAGMAVMICACLLLSENRSKVSWPLVVKGTLLQIVLAFIMLKTASGQAVFGWIDRAVMKVLDCASAGAEFVFSPALTDSGVAGRIFGPDSSFIFAFQALPVIIFLSALTALLYHWGVMQKIVGAMALVMRKTLGISGAEACNTAANVFLGQTEAPLTVTPYLAKMTRSELFLVMTGGMATISGGTLAAYVAMLSDYVPGIAGHMVAASIMSAPAAVVFAKIICPETGVPETLGIIPRSAVSTDANSVDACSRGCTDGLRMALNVAAMLIGFISLLALVNLLWGALARVFGWTACDSVQELLGWIFYPFAALLGVPWTETRFAGTLLGEKTVLNEFVAYLHFAGGLTESGCEMSLRTRVIISYALCGFANISSIGIQIAGIGSLAPGRRGELSGMAFKAMVAGTFASFSTAVIAGMMM